MLNPVNTRELERLHISGDGDEAVKWEGAFVAFFAAAMFTQTFDNVMQPPNSHVIGTPNRMGEGAPPPRAV